MALSEAETARYARQLVLPDLGEGAHERLRAARVHVVGAAQAGGPALLYLAQAGIGTVLVDDGGDVVVTDSTAWLYGPEATGEPRLLAAMKAIVAASAFTKARPYATTGAHPTAVLVCAPTRSVARTAAERARLAGVPHVVALAQGDGGEVVAVPSGAPCYNCGSKPGTGAMPRPDVAAAIGVLGALELVLIVAGVASPHGGGRRIELTGGDVRSAPTARIPGCDCRNVY